VEGYFEQTGLTNGLFAISDGTFNNLLMVRYSPINKLQIESTGGVNIIETSTRPSGNYKIAVKYSSSGVELWVNGSKIEETSTVSTMSGVNQLMVGKSPYGNIVGYKNKALAVWKEALTDTELELLTAPAPEFPTFTLDFDTIAEQFTFTRGSEATFVNEQGLIQSTASNDAPRIDYSTGVEAFLLEPQSTNLITYSEDFSLLDERNNAVVTNNVIVSPSGLLNADEITFDGTSDGRVQTSFSSTNGQSYTMSVYLKNKDLSDVTQVWIGFSASGQGQFVTITDKWQRYDVTSIANGTIEYPRVQFSGTGSLYAWGFQEELSYATSYIPTDGASATRNNETCKDATPTINSEEGVLYAEISALADGTNQRWISIGSGSNANRVSILFNATNRVSCSVRGSSSAIYEADFNIGSQTNNTKVAIRYKNSDFAFFVNGVKVDSQQSGSLSFNASLSELSFDSADGGSKFFGNTKDLQVFDKALSDYQLKQLTTI